MGGWVGGWWGAEAVLRLRGLTSLRLSSKGGVGVLHAHSHMQASTHTAAAAAPPPTPPTHPRARARAGITALPPAITRLCALQALDLSGTRLASLPAAISGLSCLRELRLNRRVFVLCVCVWEGGCEG